MAGFLLSPMTTGETAAEFLMSTPVVTSGTPDRGGGRTAVRTWLDG
jgi:hypothetical protein